MGHTQIHTPEISVVTSEEPTEPTMILVTPQDKGDRKALEAEVDQLATSLDAVVDSGVFVHWSEPKKKVIPMPKKAAGRGDQAPASFGREFAPDSAIDDGAGVPQPTANDDHGDRPPDVGTE